MDTSELTPLITAIASFVVAITALIKVLQTLHVAEKTHEVVQNTTAAIKRIDIATNGALQAQKDLVTALQSTKATTAEIAARLAVSPPVPTGTWHFTPGVLQPTDEHSEEGPPPP